MKQRLLVLAASCIAATMLVTTTYAVQGGGGEVRPKDNSKGGKGSRKGSGTGKRDATGPVVRSTAADLTIQTIPGGCSVVVNGQSRGTTGEDGLLYLKGLKPGRYVIKTGKPGFRDDQRTVDVYAGHTQLESVGLAALPGSLSVSVNVAGASIEVSGVGSYTGSVSGLSVAPGTYRVRVMSTGYADATDQILVRPGQPASLSVVLRTLSVDEQVSQAFERFAAAKYPAVIETCRAVLVGSPGRADASLLLGATLFRAKDYDGSIQPLVDAVRGGASISFPISHHHSLMGLNSDKCDGTLVLNSERLVFVSDLPFLAKQNFSVPLSKVAELKSEPQKDERLHMKVFVPKKAVPPNTLPSAFDVTGLSGVAAHPQSVIRSSAARPTLGTPEKEDDRSYNFHPSEARLVRISKDMVSISCYGCPPTMRVIYEIIRQLQQ